MMIQTVLLLGRLIKWFEFWKVCGLFLASIIVTNTIRRVTVIHLVLRVLEVFLLNMVLVLGFSIWYIQLGNLDHQHSL
jgi:hypothetical protein